MYTIVTRQVCNEFHRFLEELRARQKETDTCIIRGIADIVLEYVSNILCSLYKFYVYIGYVQTDNLRYMYMLCKDSCTHVHVHASLGSVGVKLTARHVQHVHGNTCT